MYEVRVLDRLRRLPAEEEPEKGDEGEAGNEICWRRETEDGLKGCEEGRNQPESVFREVGSKGRVGTQRTLSVNW